MSIIEYEAVIICNDDFVASASGADREEVIREGRNYLHAYAEEGAVEMTLYKKEIVLVEGIPEI